MVVVDQDVLSQLTSLGNQHACRLFVQVPLATFLTVMFKKNPLGTFKQHDNAEFGSGFSATYIKQVIDGDEVLELDYLANIFRVGGEDMLSDYRSNIGG